MMIDTDYVPNLLEMVGTRPHLYKNAPSPADAAPGDSTFVTVRKSVTSDGGWLVGRFPPTLGRERADITGATHEMAERLAEINATLARIQERFATMERAHAEWDSSASTPHVSALAWVKAATGLSDDRVASLLGVTRQALVRWRQGGVIAATKRRHLFAVRDVLERATRQHRSVEALGAWLDTPQGLDGQTPAALLGRGEFDKARLWAVTQGSSTVVMPPAWARDDVSPREQTVRGQSALPPWYEDDVAGEDEETDTGIAMRYDMGDA